MGRELRFIDPAFRCEVVLSGTARALYEAAERQFERLKGIRSLGLGAHLDEIALHTRKQPAQAPTDQGFLLRPGPAFHFFFAPPGLRE